jgi:hypothetical protein
MKIYQTSISDYYSRITEGSQLSSGTPDKIENILALAIIIVVRRGQFMQGGP